jgi:hypothetical protein
MKKTLFLTILLTSLFVGCSPHSKTELSQDCKDLTASLDISTQGYYLNCIKSCFKVSGEYLTNLGMKDKLRDNCDLACRDSVPYEEINKIKSFIDRKYNCGFSYVTRPNPLDIKK